MEKERYIGSYRLIRSIGKGGMGEVFEAYQPQIERRVAIKRMNPALSRDAEFARRFLNEARAVNRVRHHGLVSIYEFGQAADGALYLVMEYLEGETLQQRFARRADAGSAAAWTNRILRLARQLASALAAAHAVGIVHRDLKPDNVMLIADAAAIGGERAMLLDFGIAKLSGAPMNFATQVGVALGTPHYMAPEQCYGAAQLDGKADVYALGVVLFEALSGCRPIEGDEEQQVMARHITTPPRELGTVAPQLPAQLQALVMQLLSKDSTQRPSMAEVCVRLDALIPDGDPTASAQHVVTSTRPASEGMIPAVGVTQQARQLRPLRPVHLMLPLAVGAALTWVLLSLQAGTPHVSAPADAQPEKPPIVAPPIVDLSLPDAQETKPDPTPIRTERVTRPSPRPVSTQRVPARTPSIVRAAQPQLVPVQKTTLRSDDVQSLD